ncbi:Gp37-like protein [Bacillus sp. AFS040349]|uniref:Gp37-like protein n=1 Tax=Bacillaceae TaxID=186817 RepID=UPI00350E4DE7
MKSNCCPKGLLCHLLTQRNDNKQGNAETVMKHYVNTNIVNSVDANRKIPQLIVAPN